MPKTSKSCEKMRDFTKNYFHLNSSAVYNSSAKNKNNTTNSIEAAATTRHKPTTTLWSLPPHR